MTPGDLNPSKQQNKTENANNKAKYKGTTTRFEPYSIKLKHDLFKIISGERYGEQSMHI